MDLFPARSTSHEAACARVAALFPQRWLRGYAGSKLRSDKIFQAAYDSLGDSHAPILDIGCGVGLLPFYLRERGLDQPITGIDLDARKILRAREAASKAAYDSLVFLEGNAAGALPSCSGHVVLFDVLHYLAPAQQELLLRQAAARVSPGALLLLRDCPRDSSARFWITYACERFAQTISWNIGVPLHFPTREEIHAAFPPEKFSGDETPMWGRGPFNNRLFAFRRRV